VGGLAAAALLAAGMVPAVASRPAAPGSRQMVRVVIPPGLGMTAVGQLLASRGVIRSALAFEVAAVASGRAGHLQAGEYELSPGMSLETILEILAAGRVVTYRVTVPEGWDVEQVARALAAAGLGSQDDFQRAARDPALVGDLEPPGLPVRYPVEGFLFPDTYTFTRSMTPRQILAEMVGRFRRAWSPALASEAAREGLTPFQVVTLASIVEREARVPGERPVIAGVYLNRLRRGMALEADPTVLYAVGRTAGPLTAGDLKVPSPYNTYLRPGLPAGPIANPGLASLEAVVRPAQVPYLYFVAKPDGTHAFARTFQEQLSNEGKYLGR
jgi:UPF0755 protein